jgi:WD40 repeat protein
MDRPRAVLIGLLLISCRATDPSGAPDRGGAVDHRGGSPVDATPAIADAPPGVPDATPQDAPAPDAAPPDAAPPDAWDIPDAGPIGATACGGLVFTQAFTSTPAPAGVDYLRCDTRGHERGIRVALSRDGTHLAILTTAGTVRLFATSPWVELAQLASPTTRLSGLQFSPDGSLLATYAESIDELALWRTTDGTLARRWVGWPYEDWVTRDDPLDAIAFSADGLEVAASPQLVADLATDSVERRFLGVGTRLLTFTGVDDLFVDSMAYTGMSPWFRYLSVIDVAADTAQPLYENWDYGTSYAVSHANRLAYSEYNGDLNGIREVTLPGGAGIAFVPELDTVVGFTVDGTRLVTMAGTSIHVRAAADLHVVSTFDVPSAPFHVLGISPEDDLVFAMAGETRWWSLATGTQRQSMPVMLDDVAWSADGRYGAGVAADALFTMWDEDGATVVCRPPALEWGLATPPDGSTELPEGATETSADGSTTLVSTNYIHTHGDDYYKVSVGGEPRFGPAATRAMWFTEPDAARIYTSDGQWPSVLAGWCR